jgi:hypothetical protein
MCAIEAESYAGDYLQLISDNLVNTKEVAWCPPCMERDDGSADAPGLSGDRRPKQGIGDMPWVPYGILGNKRQMLSLLI